MLIHNTDGDVYGGVVGVGAGIGDVGGVGVVAGVSDVGDVGVGTGVGDVGGVGVASGIGGVRVCAGVGDVGRGGFQFLLLLVSGGLVAAKERSCQGKTWLKETFANHEVYMGDYRKVKRSSDFKGTVIFGALVLCSNSVNWITN